jgi:hypothetical protein
MRGGGTLENRGLIVKKICKCLIYGVTAEVRIRSKVSDFPTQLESLAIRRTPVQEPFWRVGSPMLCYPPCHLTPNCTHHWNHQWKE